MTQIVWSFKKIILIHFGLYCQTYIKMLVKNHVPTNLTPSQKTNEASNYSIVTKA